MNRPDGGRLVVPIDPELRAMIVLETARRSGVDSPGMRLALQLFGLRPHPSCGGCDSVHEHCNCSDSDSLLNIEESS